MDNTNPLVSICIPTFNRAQMVLRAIESCINQTYKNIEIVVSDSASADNTREVVLNYANRDSRIKYFRNETNIGSGRNFLECAKSATGYFIQALGDDDWLSRNYVEEGVKNFIVNPQTAAVLTNIITLESLEGGVQFCFLDEILLDSGKYSVDWFFRNIYLGKPGGAGFISLLRRSDFIEAMEIILNDPVNLFPRDNRSEPFDMPIFLEVLAKYDYYIFTKESAYIKIIHGKDQVGLQGEAFKSQAGLIRYETAVCKSYESFYLRHGFKKHFRQLRFFKGLSILANGLLFFFKKCFIKKEKGEYFSAVKNYFKDYSKREKLLIIVSITPYAFFKIANRFLNFFARKPVFVPSPNYFLTDAFVFKTGLISKKV